MLLPVGGLFLFMSNEGYPTLAGVRNIFNPDGEIRIALPSGYTISHVRLDGDSPYSTVISDNAATIRVGYTHATITLRYTTDGQDGHIQFNDVRKLNDWNRLIFSAEPDPSGMLSFHIEENGVTRDPKNYNINQTTQQEAEMVDPETAF